MGPLAAKTFSVGYVGAGEGVSFHLLSGHGTAWCLTVSVQTLYLGRVDSSPCTSVGSWVEVGAHRTCPSRLRDRASSSINVG